MTGLVLRVAGADFSASAIGFVPPVAGNLAYWNFLGGDSTKTARNLADGGAASTIVGSPAINSNSAVFGPGTSFLQTSVAQTASSTVIAVFKMPTEASSFVVSNYQSQRKDDSVTSNGMSLYTTAGAAGDGFLAVRFNQSQYSGVAGQATSNSLVELAASVPVATFRAVVGRCDAATHVRKIVDLTNGTSSSLTSASVEDIGSASLRIGSGYTNTGFTASNEVAFVAIYQRALSDAEISKVYSFLKAYYAGNGITI